MANKQASGGITLAKVLSHPMRVQILMKMNSPRRAMSPVRFSEEAGLPLGNVSYHFRELEKAGCVEVVETIQRRGATEHVYEPSKRAMAWTREWESLGAVVKQNLAAVALRGAVEALGAAIDSGMYDSREGSHLAYDTLWVDELGWTELGMAVKSCIEEMLAITFEAGERLKQDPDAPRFLASYVLTSFQSPEPED